MLKHLTPTFVPLFWFSSEMSIDQNSSKNLGLLEDIPLMITVIGYVFVGIAVLLLAGFGLSNIIVQKNAEQSPQHQFLIASDHGEEQNEESDR